MKIPKIVHMLGQIDEDLIAAAAAPSVRVTRPWAKWAILAATFGVVALAGVISLPMLLGGNDNLPTDEVPTTEALPLGNVVSFGDLDRHYKDQDAVGQESAFEWPEKYKTTLEKHHYIVWSLREYLTNTVPVRSEHLGDRLGDYLGYEVRAINGVDPEHAIAVKIDGVYYNYRCSVENYSDQPTTLGALFDLYRLSELLEFDRFTVYKNKFDVKGYYALTDDAYILEVLASCRDAKMIDDTEIRYDTPEDYLSFTISSDRLGVHKVVLYISEDGYFKTNLFAYPYVYEIGKEAAGKIIDYAMANSVEKQYEPYEYRLAGTLIKVEDGYAYIDDSIMCTDPDDGMVFRVSTEDLRIRRWLEYEHAGVDVGDLVVVTFRGGIAVEDGNLILDARSIVEAYLSDGDAYVPE